MRSMIRVRAANASPPAPPPGMKRKLSWVALMAISSGTSITGPMEVEPTWISQAHVRAKVARRLTVLPAPYRFR